MLRYYDCEVVSLQVIRKANLDDADLRGANMVGLHPCLVDLRRARYTQAGRPLRPPRGDPARTHGVNAATRPVRLLRDRQEITRRRGVSGL